MTKGFVLSLILLAFASSAAADAAAPQFISGLFQVLPPKAAPYVGRNNGRGCAVTVSFQPSYQLYIVTVAQETKAGGVQQMSFAIDPNSRVSPRSYIGRFSEFIETSVEVEMGPMVSFPSTYGTFAERTMGLEIRKNNEVKSPTARKIWVTNQRAGKIGASGPACIIELAK